MTDDKLKRLLQLSRTHPLKELKERGGELALNTFSISQHRPLYSNGWSFSLWPESCFYKRWFDFPDIGMMGWAVMFHIVSPIGEEIRTKWRGETEHFPGWVPPERGPEADKWIAILNAEIAKRLAEAKPGEVIL